MSIDRTQTRLTQAKKTTRMIWPHCVVSHCTHLPAHSAYPGRQEPTHPLRECTSTEPTAKNVAFESNSARGALLIGQTQPGPFLSPEPQTGVPGRTREDDRVWPTLLHVENNPRSGVIIQLSLLAVGPGWTDQALKRKAGSENGSVVLEGEVT